MPPNAAVPQIETIVFDLDGTLYDDVRIYDRFAGELAHFLSPSTADRFQADWSAAKAGSAVPHVGMGYDRERDRLFRFRGSTIFEYIDWDGNRQPANPAEDDANPEEDEQRSLSTPQQPPVEVPIFGEQRVNIGDWWALSDTLATHYGVVREQRQEAFMATRAWMRDSLPVSAEPWLRRLLARLVESGLSLIAMSNSPSPSVEEVIERLGITDYFDRIMPSSRKPLGMTEFLANSNNPGRALSIGDNYVNDIEPALRACAWALYIDRHATGLGAERERLISVPRRQAAAEWIEQNVSGLIGTRSDGSP